MSKNRDALVRVGLQKKVQDEHLYLWISTRSNLEHVPLGYIWKASGGNEWAQPHIWAIMWRYQAHMLLHTLHRNAVFCWMQLNIWWSLFNKSHLSLHTFKSGPLRRCICFDVNDMFSSSSFPVDYIIYFSPFLKKASEWLQKTWNIVVDFFLELYRVEANFRH